MKIKIDTLFVNGTFYTMESEGATVESVASLHGRIFDAGTKEELMEKYDAGEVVDMGGRCVLPGLIDTHCHVAEWCEGMRKVDLTEAATVEKVLAMLKEALANVPEGHWLMGYQVTERKIGRLPNRWELDTVSDTVPIFLEENGFHSFMVNSPMLRLLGVDKYFHGPGSQYCERREEDGEINGIFREHGMIPYIMKNYRSVFKDEDDMLDGLREGLMRWSRYGYTTVHSCDGFSGSPIDEIGTYQKLERQGRLPMRVVLNKQRAVDNSMGAISGLGDDMVRYGAFKIFIDGSFSGRSALLTEDYADDPGNRGKIARSYEEFCSLVRHAYELGNDLAIHVIGDAAVDWVLKALESFYDPKRKDQQIALIHVSLTRPDQWEKMARYPIVLETQPIFLPDMEHSREHRLDEKRARWLMAYRSWMDQGLIVAGGEDGPIYSSDPFLSMYYAVTRRIHDDVYLNPEQAVSVYEAVSMYTKNASFCAHEETRKGTITPGKYADFAVLDRDIFHISPEKLKDVKNTRTYLGGKLVWDGECGKNLQCRGERNV